MSMMYKFTIFLILLLTCYQKFAMVHAVTIPDKKDESHGMKRDVGSSVIKRNFKELSCKDLIRFFEDTDNVTFFCMNVNPSLYFISDVFAASIPFNNNTENQLNNSLNVYCSSECKELYVAYYNCINFTEFASFLNDGMCGRINQEYCMMRFLRGFTSGVIMSPRTFARGCGRVNSFTSYCTDGSCQNNVTQFIDYMECCGGPILDFYFNLTTCSITNTDPCRPSGVVGFQSSSLFAVLVLAAIIQVIIFYY